MRRDITSHGSQLLAASGSQQTLQLTLSPWVGIQWDLNVIQDINSCCTLFVVTRHLAFTAAFSHLGLCDSSAFRDEFGRSEASLSPIGTLYKAALHAAVLAAASAGAGVWHKRLYNERRVRRRWDPRLPMLVSVRRAGSIASLRSRRPRLARGSRFRTLARLQQGLVPRRAIEQ